MRDVKDDSGNFEWARNLIAMVFTLWMPSPGESLKEIVESRNRNLQKLAEIKASSEKDHNSLSIGTNEFGTLKSDLNDTIRVGEPQHVSAFQELLNTFFKTNNADDSPKENDIEMGLPETSAEQPPTDKSNDTENVNTNTDTKSVGTTVKTNTNTRVESANTEKTEYKIQIEVVDD
jgi:hypothetical protein